MAVVYVVQEVRGRNLTAAREYGELRALLDPDYQCFLRPDHSVALLKQALTGFTVDDHLLLMGDPVLIGMASAIAAFKTGGFVKLLKWDAQAQKYYAIPVTLT
jgi:hypothetical protein